MTEKERIKKRLYRIRRRNDPIRHAKDLLKRKEKSRQNRLMVLEKRKQSPYWQRNKYERYYQYRPFKRLANQCNKRCKLDRVRAKQIWSLAKKQKLICAITGEKLTRDNVSLDHKIPISKGGTNNIGNLQLVTRHSNTIKNNMSMNELISFCQNIISRHAPGVPAPI